jgi:hypothetical protein
MQWDDTSLFLHLEPVETSTQSRSVPNSRNELKGYSSIQQEQQSQERHRDLLPEFNLTPRGLRHH